MHHNAFTRARAARRDEGGFTLIELLLVVVILGVLAAIVAFSVRGISDRGEESACKAEVKTVATAIEAHYAKEGTYPASLTVLETAGLLRSDDAEYVANALGADGSMTLTGAPAGCTAA